MNISVNAADGKVLEEMALPDRIFSAPINAALIHQVVVADMAALRQGSKAQKNRSAVRGGGAKPWRQKGTGRARSGTTRSPIWRTGGVTFAAEPRNYAQKINKKMYRAAMRSTLSALAQEGRMKMVDSLALFDDGNAPKTKAAVEFSRNIGLKDALLVSNEMSDNLWLATRNLYALYVIEQQDLRPVHMLQFDEVVFEKPALDALINRL